MLSRELKAKLAKWQSNDSFARDYRFSCALWTLLVVPVLLLLLALLYAFSLSMKGVFGRDLRVYSFRDAVIPLAVIVAIIVLLSIPRWRSLPTGGKPHARLTTWLLSWGCGLGASIVAVSAFLGVLALGFLIIGGITSGWEEEIQREVGPGLSRDVPYAIMAVIWIGAAGWLAWELACAVRHRIYVQRKLSSLKLRKLIRGYSDLTEAQKTCCCDLALVALPNLGLLSVDPEQRNESLDFLRRAAGETPVRSASVILRALRSNWRSKFPAKKRCCIHAAKALNAMPLEGFDRRMVQQLVTFHKNLAGTIEQWKEPHGLEAEDKKEFHRIDLLLRPLVGKILGRLKREGLYEPDVGK